MRILRLSFTGDGLPTAAVDFVSDLNVIYGASNAGKSLIIKSVDYLLGGGASFPHVRESKDYEDAFLTIRLFPEGRAVTLRRSMKGGAVDWFEGAENEVQTADVKRLTLTTTHGKPKGASLSERLLSEIGVPDAKILKNNAGVLESFSFRGFMPYVLMTEARMFGDEGPLKQSGPNKTAAKNIFRFLLTGKDDSGIARVHTAQEAKASKAGKIELLESMLFLAEAEVLSLPAADPSDPDVAETLQQAAEAAQSSQGMLDQLVRERRSMLDRLGAMRMEASEIETSLVRYGDLEEVFRSDVRRLQAIEEGGFLLRRFDDQPCPLCGAAPGDQHHPHGPDDLEQQHAAALREIAKIERDSGDLRELIASMTAELEGLRARAALLVKNIESIETRISELRPQESSLRERFRILAQRADRLRVRTETVARRDGLAKQLEEIRKLKASGPGKDGVPQGITSNVAHDISQVVLEVLRKWDYPEISAVRWDPQADDIEVDGWPRSGNGKGVKAIFHSALKIAVLIYCRRRSLPHPGFLFLDSPLVTYREPVMNERHGELAADELAVRKTALDERFYEHLESLTDMAQFIILENNDPPWRLRSSASVELFAGATGDGRKGLFPPMS